MIAATTRKTSTSLQSTAIEERNVSCQKRALELQASVSCAAWCWPRQAGRQGGEGEISSLGPGLHREITTGRCKEAPGCWASTLLLLAGFAAFDLLKSPLSISKELKLVLLGHAGSASGQAYFQIESNCPTKSATTETQSPPLVSLASDMDCVPAEILPVLERFTAAPPIQNLWCVITFNFAPAFPPAETLVESLPFAQLPVFIKLAKT